MRGAHLCARSAAVRIAEKRTVARCWTLPGSTANFVPYVPLPPWGVAVQAYKRLRRSPCRDAPGAGRSGGGPAAVPRGDHASGMADTALCSRPTWRRDGPVWPVPLPHLRGPDAPCPLVDAHRLARGKTPDRPGMPLRAAARCRAAAGCAVYGSAQAGETRCTGESCPDARSRLGALRQRAFDRAGAPLETPIRR